MGLHLHKAPTRPSVSGECGPWALPRCRPAGDPGHLPKHQRLFPWPLTVMPWKSSQRKRCGGCGNHPRSPDGVRRLGQGLVSKAVDGFKASGRAWFRNPRWKSERVSVANFRFSEPTQAVSPPPHPPPPSSRVALSIRSASEHCVSWPYGILA